jgi:signal transduction histidine kinase
VLGVLRDADSDADAGVRPPPTAADLDRLCADARAAGADLRAEISGAELPPALSREAYRIVQEALTNATRHGAAGPMTLRLIVADEVTIELTNPLGAGGRTESNGGGRGIAGMRERVTLLGGRLEVGPDGRTWRVSARLPLGGPG